MLLACEGIAGSVSMLHACSSRLFGVLHSKSGRQADGTRLLYALAERLFGMLCAD